MTTPNLEQALRDLAYLRQTMEHVAVELRQAHVDEALLGQQVRALDETVRQLKAIVSGERNGKDGLAYRLLLFEREWERLAPVLAKYEAAEQTLRPLVTQVQELREARTTWQQWWLQRLGRWTEIAVMALFLWLAAQMLAPKLWPQQTLPPIVVPFSTPK